LVRALEIRSRLAALESDPGLVGDRADRILPGGAGFLAEHLGYNGFFYLFAGIAVVGATLMLLTGVLGLKQAVSLSQSTSRHSSCCSG
jgi:hypothetical protein